MSTQAEREEFWASLSKEAAEDLRARLATAEVATVHVSFDGMQALHCMDDEEGRQWGYWAVGSPLSKVSGYEDPFLKQVKPISTCYPNARPSPWLCLPSTILFASGKA